MVFPNLASHAGAVGFLGKATSERNAHDFQIHHHRKFSRTQGTIVSRVASLRSGRVFFQIVGVVKASPSWFLRTFSIRWLWCMRVTASFVELRVVVFPFHPYGHFALAM